MKVTEKEIESVSKLEPFRRYQYCLKRIADHTIIYSLKMDDGNWAISMVENNNLFPIWPAAEYAKNCAINEWERFSVIAMPFDVFQTDLMVNIAIEKFLLNVFPVGATTGFVVDLEEFIRDLRVELEKYE
jgi:hypothetical protein